MKKLKKVPRLAICCFFLCTFFFSTISVAQYKQELMLRFEDGTPDTTIDNMRIEFNATEVNITPISEIRLWRLDSIINIPGNDTLFFLIGSDTMTIKESRKHASSKTKVKSAGENKRTYITPDSQEIDLGSGPTGNPTLCTPMKPITCSPGACKVRIAILDTGVDYHNTYLPPWLSSVPHHDFVNNGGMAQDGHGHGTHIAGTIAQMADMEMTTAVRIVPLKTQDDDGFGTVFNAIQAIDYSIMHELDVINMSLGYVGDRPSGPMAHKPRPLEYAINLAGETRGIIVVCAAGNEAANIDTTLEAYYPAGFTCNNLISVAASRCDDQLYSFSNYGNASVDVSAPGSVHSTLLSNQWGIKDGTSMASGVVAGLAGLLGTKACLSGNTETDFFPLKDVILGGADRLSLPLSTKGRINGHRSLQLLLPMLREAPDVEEEQNLADLQVYPQPFQNVVNIEWESSQEAEGDLMVLDMLGRVVYQQKQMIHKGRNSFQWHCTEQATGSYLLVLTVGEKRLTKKLMKMN